MKRKILLLIMATTLTVSLTACSKTENEVQNDSTVVEEDSTAVEEVSSEIKEDTTTVEETPTETETEKEVIVHEGITLNNGDVVNLVSYNENCSIAEGLKIALGSDLYPGITIEYLGEDNWYLYYEGDPQAEDSVELGFDESALSEETVNKVVEYLSGNVQTFTDMNNGIIPAVDLNEDGILSPCEVYIIDMMRTTENLSFTGLFQLEGTIVSMAERFTKDVKIIPLSQYLSENNTDGNIETTTSAENSSSASHTYNWGIMEFDGEYSMEISIIANGIPSEAGSTIDFCVKNSIFDYKLFSEIKCEGDTILNKEIKPDWADSSSDGIIGFIGDGFKLTSDGTSVDDEGRLTISFCFTGNVDGKYHEYSVVWENDGSVTVSIGDLV